MTDEHPGGTSPSTPHPSPAPASTPAAGPGELTALVCERCGNVSLVRVKGCWYCERCHYKFDCYGW
jgi:hypothetical protein